MEKSLDLICLGRASVDLYSQQIGARLEDVSSFAKYIGGSSTNIAACSARMGLKSGLITRVGDEHMGRFIREQLQREGVDTQCVVSDPERLTALVLLGIEDQDTFPLIFYRENCADMAISPDDFNEEYIASAKALLITGTHFSTETVANASGHAIALAKTNGVKTALDIDYRPVLWGLTARGDGETRFIADDGVTAHLQKILPDFDLIVGTEEEIHIAGGSTDTVSALRTIHELSDATLVLKRGPLGAVVFDGAIPDQLDDGIHVPGVKVDVLNVLGAGDGFMAGFLRGWINNEGHEQSLRYANACGALVVSRNGCTPAMPTVEELDYYLGNAAHIPRPDKCFELNYLHRVTTRVPRSHEVCALAFDHRSQFVDMAREAGVSVEHLPYLKSLLLTAAEHVADDDSVANRIGILCDDSFGQAALNAATGRNWWIGRPVEVPGSRPLELEGVESIGSRLQSWPNEHIVKCLTFYHPDDPAELRHAQETDVAELFASCCTSGHELLLEVIPPAGSENFDDAVVRAVERFYNLNIFPDWWKLPTVSRDSMNTISDIIDKRSPHCRGIVILGLDKPIGELSAGFADVKPAKRVVGFAVGRTIFGEPCRQWLLNRIDDDTLVSQVATNFRAVIQAWDDT